MEVNLEVELRGCIVTQERQIQEVPIVCSTLTKHTQNQQIQRLKVQFNAARAGEGEWGVTA